MRPSPAIFHLVLTAAPPEGCCYSHPPLTDEETGAQRAVPEVRQLVKISEPHGFTLAPTPSSGCQALAVGRTPAGWPEGLGGCGALGPGRGTPRAREGAYLPHPIGRPSATVPPGIRWHSCGGGVAARGSVCPGHVPVAMQAPAPGAESAGWAAGHSQQISITRKVVAEWKRKLYFP